MRETDISQKINALMQLPDENLFRMQGEREMIAKEFGDRLNQIFQIRPIRRCYCKIIGIAGIMFYMEFMFHELIEFVHIDVREKLGRKVANGYTFRRDRTLSLSLSLSNWH